MQNLDVFQIGYEKSLPGKRAIRQVSAYNMLHFVVSGSGIFNDQPVHAGQMFLCRQRHFIDYRPCDDDPWSYYWINSTGPLSSELLADCGFDGQQLVVDFAMTDEVEQLLKMSLFNTNNDYMCGIFIAVAGLIHQSSQRIPPSLPERHLENAVRIIDRTNGSITPASLAAKMGLSRGYLRNIFSQYKGMSLMDYILRQRMIIAAELLTQTEYSIAVIASAVGYEDQFQFAKRFRVHFGISPSQYRRDMKRYKDCLYERAPLFREREINKPE